MDAARSRQPHILCGLRQGISDLMGFIDIFLEAAEEMVLGDVELVVHFNGGLNDPILRSEIRMLRPLGLNGMVRYAMNRPEPRFSVQSSYPSLLAAILEGSPPAASPPPTSLRGRRGRREPRSPN